MTDATLDSWMNIVFASLMGLLVVAAACLLAIFIARLLLRTSDHIKEKK